MSISVERNRNLISPVWFFCAAVGLSLSWLLPNHTPPWLGFHCDAISAVILICLCLGILLRSKAPIGVNPLALSVLICAFIPWIQFSFGMIASSGVAWINSLYLAGFYLAIRMGERWEAFAPGRGGDFIFIAILLAATISVGLQFYQWMGLEPISPWMLSVPGNNRFYANMAQPNKLASLLLLGVVGCSWGVCRKKIHFMVAFVVACCLLWGVALTESRTAWINVALIYFLCIVGVAKRFLSKKYLIAASVLMLILVVFVLLHSYARQALVEGIGGERGVEVRLRQASDSVRINGWSMFFKATLLQPLTGYGWGQIPKAQFLAIGNSINSVGLFSQAHNILLDLILWNGWVLGAGLISVVSWWIWRTCIRILNIEQMHLVAFVLILGVHAMLEFPLHYANFLLPMGLVIGVLNIQCQLKIVFGMSWRLDFFKSIVVTLALCLTIFEYFRIENSFYGLRFENRGIQTGIEKYPNNIYALTQFSDYFYLVRYETKGIDTNELRWMEGVVNALPSPVGMYKLAEGFAFNEQPEEAKKWLKTICITLPSVNCEEMKQRWLLRARTEKEIAAVNWPD
jgi:hypothetical protein